jgi:hypothetical protein
MLCFVLFYGRLKHVKINLTKGSDSDKKLAAFALHTPCYIECRVHRIQYTALLLLVLKDHLNMLCKLQRLTNAGWEHY